MININPDGSVECTDCGWTADGFETHSCKQVWEKRITELEAALNNIGAQVDKIRYSMRLLIQTSEVKALLELFDADSAEYIGDKDDEQNIPSH